MTGALPLGTAPLMSVLRIAGKKFYANCWQQVVPTGDCSDCPDVNSLNWKSEETLKSFTHHGD